MRIIADENIPGLEVLEADDTEVITLDGRVISAKHLADADALFVRSVTQVDEALLHNSQVKFVATATSGVDHIDRDYLQSKNISFQSAHGANAFAVAEYTLSAIDYFCRQRSANLNQCSVAVVGVGKVGGLLCRLLHNQVATLLPVDPFLDSVPGCGQLQLTDLNTALSADVICLHVPLTTEGPNATLNLIAADQLRRLKPSALLINACRGGVVNEAALLKKLCCDDQAVSGGTLSTINKEKFCCVLDVWDNEPNIKPELLEKVDWATPHIAGYSRQAKEGATQMVLRGFYQFLGDESKPRGGVGKGSVGNNQRAGSSELPRTKDFLSNDAMLGDFKLHNFSKPLVAQQEAFARLSVELKTAGRDQQIGNLSTPGFAAKFDAMRKRVLSERNEFLR